MAKAIEKVSLGDKSVLGIECCIMYQRDSGSRNLVGSLEFWVRGVEICNSDVVSTIGIGARSINLTLGCAGQRRDSALFGTDRSSVLDFIHESIYGETDPERAERGEKFLVFAIASGNEWTDGWLIVMIEGSQELGNADRVLYRRPDGSDHEAFIPTGEYDRVARSFLGWFYAAEKRWNVSVL